MSGLFPARETGAARSFSLLQGDEVGLGEAWGAGITKGEIKNSFSGRWYREGHERMLAVAERLGPAGSFYVGRIRDLGYIAPDEVEQLFALAREQADKEPGAWADVPTSPEALDAQIALTFRNDQRDAAGVVDRAEGVASWVALAGEMVGLFNDPVNLSLAMFGAGATSLARTVLWEGLLNAAAEAVNLPGQIAVEDRLDLDPSNPVTQVAAGAAFGAALPLAGRGLAIGYRAGRRAVDNFTLLKAARERAASLAPEQRAAVNVLEAEAQAQAANPGLAPEVLATALERTERTMALGTPSAPDHSAGADVAVRAGTVGDRIRQVESGGRATAANPNSSALGPDQFIASTWLEVARQHAPDLFEGRTEAEVLALRTDPAVSARLRDAHIRDIRAFLGGRGLPVHDGAVYLGWFAGRGGAVKVLSAPPDAPIGEVMTAGQIAANRSIRFRGKSFEQFTAGDLVDWARAKMGMGAGAPGDLPDPVGVREYFADEVLTDAQAFQYKAGGDAEGVTARLLQETKWDPTAGLGLSFFEAQDGRIYVADGHQRSGLARRLMAQGHEPIRLQGFVYREADGWSPAAVRAQAALTNVRNRTGTAADAAKFMRDYPEQAREVVRSDDFVRRADALSRLAPEPFMAVVNGVIPENFGAVIGRVAPGDERMQAAMLRAFRQLEPANEVEADMMARDVRRLGLERAAAGAQGDLFADFDFGVSPIAERARVLDRTLKELKRDKAVFDRLTREADRIEQEGNRLARNANEQRAEQNRRILEAILIAADEPGPVRDALDAAARTARTDGVAAASRQFAQAVRDGVASGDIGRAFDRAATRSAEAAGDAGRVSRRGAGEALDDPVVTIADAGETPRDLFGDPDAPAMAAVIDELVDEVAPPRDTDTPDLFGEPAARPARPAPERLADRLTPEQAAEPAIYAEDGSVKATVGDLLRQLDEEAEALDIVETLCGLPGGGA